MITPAYIEALEKALGRVIADMQREAARQAAEGRAMLAELRAENAKLHGEMRDAVAWRLATVKDGEPGVPGEKGEQGEQGEQGERGEKGEQGEQGAQGEAGLSGERGADGRDGNHGEKGEQGERGLTGVLPIVEDWSERAYARGQVVKHDGDLWQAIATTDKKWNAADWQIVLVRGQDGRGFAIRGTWSADKAYLMHDVVACNFSSFAALKDQPGVCPGPDWQMLAGPGKRGEKGPPGNRGERGPQGSVIIGWLTDAESYQATPLMGDGSKGPAIELRDIFQHFAIEAG